MSDAFASFILGLLCTFLMFALCVVIVVGVKAIIFAVKERLISSTPLKPAVQDKPKTEKVKRKKRPRTVAKPVRSIEIDPEQVERIYVKKIS